MISISNLFITVLINFSIIKHVNGCQLPESGSQYRVINYGGINTNKFLLSSKIDGSKVDLFNSDDGSQRQRWNFTLCVCGGYYHIEIAGGINNNRTLLSVTADGTTVDLWDIDDRSKRQRWKIIDYADYCTFEIDGGVFPANKKYLSVTSDGSKADLWHEEDGSGRQRWMLQKIN